MQFDVRTLSADNVMSRLSIDAQDENDARRQIEAKGLFAASIRPVSSLLPSAARIGNAGGRRLPLVLFNQELLALLKAGLSIVESLEALLEKESNEATRSILGRLLAGLREGKRFSGVLAEQPNLFPALYIGMVKAAEGTSDLPQALARFIEYRQQIDTVRNKIISSAIYPMILLLVGGGVSFFLMVYVVPRFADVYEGTGHSLPWMTQILLKWGMFSANHTPSLLAAMVILLAALFLTMRQLFRGNGMARLAALLPGIGERVRIYELSRLYLTLGMLGEGGIPIVAAMHMVEGMASDTIRGGLQTTISMVESGTPLSTAFEASHLTTPISLRLLRVGERTGEMGAMLSQSATFYDGETNRWIERFTRALEPLLMASIGIVVGVIVVLLYMPIFDLAGSIS
ncbi:MAG: type II secretion system F family protein [Gallionellaceae bacterium]